MIETERLILRHVRKEDAEDIFEYATDADTGPRAGWQPHRTIEDTIELLNIWMDPSSIEKVFSILYKPDNKVVGTMGVVHLNQKKKDEKDILHIGCTDAFRLSCIRSESGRTELCDRIL